MNLSKLLPYVILISVSVSSAAFRTTKKVVLDRDDYHYEATFNPNQISEVRLRELLPFSPYMGVGDGWNLNGIPLEIGFEETPELHEKSLLASSLELCLTGDPRYASCGTRTISDPNFFRNAQANVERNLKALAAVDRLQVPVELNPILKHYRESLAFYSTLQQRRLEYLRTGDVQVLSMPIGSIDLPKLCAPELKNLELATTLQQRYAMSYGPWHKCANREWHRKLRGYPTEAWRRFLDAYGIRERFTVKSID